MKELGGLKLAHMNGVDPVAKPDIIIRSAKDQDADELSALMSLPGVRHGTARLPFTTGAEARQLIGRIAVHDRFLLACENEEIIGWASLTRDGGRMAHKAYLVIGVGDGRTGRGVGTLLLTALIDYADRWLGLRRLDLDVNVDNVGARRLYESLGFEVEGIRREFVFRDGKYIDLHCMGRLNPMASR